MSLPNSRHFAFLASFICTFAFLYSVTSYLGAKLRAAGYDVSELILLGLPKTNNSTDMSASDQYYGQDFLNHSLELVSRVHVALVLAVVSGIGVFLFVKFASKSRKALSANEWKEFPLVKKIVISPNTAIYRFGLPRPGDILGLPIGQHIMIKANIGGKDITRNYTPTSSDDDRGHFDLLIKSYELGNVSKYIGLLKIGDKIQVKGPRGQFKYTPKLCRELGMIAGGTGITPMLQIIRAVLKNPTDETRLTLIYANVNVEDILLKKELDDLVRRFPTRFRVYYVLNNPPAGWTGGVGFVSKEQIEEYLRKPADDVKILMCGPPPMMTAMKKHIEVLNYPAPRAVSKLVDQVFVF